MHSIAARIALLAYIVGGMAMPVLHRHEGSVLRGAAGPHVHVHGSHSHATCHHQGPSNQGPSKAAAADNESCGQRGAATTVVAGAPAEHASACGDNCVVCSFGGSPQSAASAFAVAFSVGDRQRLTPSDAGPGFEPPASRHNRLRGPPASMILG